ncbi:histone-lysine N-methyltransferase SETMAR [Plakobranchus ocellatus]|uniref:Histone-lysine N-methyltransferase SETMAR n=1 Tax=Plakobranchus ocellatus TaxID=259542 RepID=A0AAV4CII2_9GAST|nr:histone-lysine N-methyltransferase SETMAR [Plakobranchus ocellatus]
MLFDAKDLDSCVAELSFDTTMQPPTRQNAQRNGLNVTGLEFIPHLAHSPDLAPSDFHLFGPQKRHLGGKKFEDKDELIGEVRDWFSKLDANFFTQGIYSLLPRWQKCITLHGDYLEK